MHVNLNGAGVMPKASQDFIIFFLYVYMLIIFKCLYFRVALSSTVASSYM